VRKLFVLLPALALAGLGCSGGSGKGAGAGDKPAEPKATTDPQPERSGVPKSLALKPGAGDDRAKKGRELADLKKDAVSLVLKIDDLTIAKDQDEGVLTVGITRTGKVGDVRLTFSTTSEVIAAPAGLTTAEEQVTVRVAADRSRRDQDHATVLLVTGTGTESPVTNSVKVKVKVEKK
jgi:hypothetical protein